MLYIDSNHSGKYTRRWYLGTIIKRNDAQCSVTISYDGGEGKEKLNTYTAGGFLIMTKQKLVVSTPTRILNPGARIYRPYKAAPEWHGDVVRTGTDGKQWLPTDVAHQINAMRDALWLWSDGGTASPTTIPAYGFDDQAASNFDNQDRTECLAQERQMREMHNRQDRCTEVFVMDVSPGGDLTSPVWDLELTDMGIAQLWSRQKTAGARSGAVARYAGQLVWLSQLDQITGHGADSAVLLATTTIDKGEYVQRLNAIGAPLDHCDSGGGSTSGSGQTEQASGSDAGMDSDDDNHSSDSNNGSAALGHSRDGAAEYQGPVCLPRSFIAAVALNAQLHCWPIGTSTGRGQAIEPCGDDYSCTSLNGLAPLCLGRRTALACTVLPCAVSEQRLIRHE
jgi:hypothetical protein